jgi:hydrogenase maturation protein HypF
MAAFTMCANCAREYGMVEDRPLSRAAECLPRRAARALDVRGADGRAARHDGPDRRGGPRAARRADRRAERPSAGFQLACDATSEDAVRRLRQRKHRDEKPFAVMVGGLAGAPGDRRFSRPTKPRC